MHIFFYSIVSRPSVPVIPWLVCLYVRYVHYCDKSNLYRYAILHYALIVQC